LVKSVVGGVEERAVKRSLSFKRKLYWEQVSNTAKQTNKAQQSLLDDIGIVRKDLQV